MATKRAIAESLQQRIQERAYLIWEREGRLHGRADEHWRRAEAEILAETKKPVKKRAAKPAEPPPAAPKTKRAIKKKKT